MAILLGTNRNCHMTELLSWFGAVIEPSCTGQKVLVVRTGKHKDGSALFRKVTHTKNGFALCKQKLSHDRALELVN